MSKTQTFVERLAQALVKLKIMSEPESESLVTEFKGRAKGRIDEFLLDEGIVNQDTLLKALQIVYGIPAYDVRGHFFNHQILLLFPKDFLINQCIIPLDVEDDIMTVVVSNPEDDETLEVFGNYVPYSVNVQVGIQRDIVDAIEQYYDEDVATADIHEQETDVEEDDQEDADIVDYF
ncbi:hypothetical protein KBD08_01400 [Candidatus Babeliales bacterium]|nr:hypothetical protein [Candidatus Babeliales bacterium]